MAVLKIKSMQLVKEVRAALPHDPAQISDFTIVFENAIRSFLTLAAIVLFIMLISGGFKFILSGGNPEAAAGAKRTITYAIGGLIVIASAYLILVIIEEITGAKVTEFNI